MDRDSDSVKLMEGLNMISYSNLPSHLCPTLIKVDLVYFLDKGHIYLDAVSSSSYHFANDTNIVITLADMKRTCSRNLIKEMVFDTCAWMAESNIEFSMSSSPGYPRIPLYVPVDIRITSSGQRVHLSHNVLSSDMIYTYHDISIIQSSLFMATKPTYRKGSDVEISLSDCDFASFSINRREVSFPCEGRNCTRNCNIFTCQFVFEIRRFLYLHRTNEDDPRIILFVIRFFKSPEKSSLVLRLLGWPPLVELGGPFVFGKAAPSRAKTRYFFSNTPVAQLGDSPALITSTVVVGSK